MMAVSSIHLLKITGRFAMIQTTFFYIPVNFAFNLPHYVTSFMHDTGKKESKKEIITEKEKKNKVIRNLLQGDSNPQNQ